MIELGHDQKGLFSDWFVELVTISCSHDSGRVYEFPCGNWVQRTTVIFKGKGKVELYFFMELELNGCAYSNLLTMTPMTAVSHHNGFIRK